jgi:hypothetical protein
MICSTSLDRLTAASSPATTYDSQEGGREKRKVRSPSPRPTSLATSSAEQPETSTPSWRDETDKSVEKSKDESPVKKTTARKKRVRKISSSSSGSSSSSSSSSNSSSSEDEAMAEEKALDRREEEQLRVLKKKQAACKRLKSWMEEKGPDQEGKEAQCRPAQDPGDREGG